MFQSRIVQSDPVPSSTPYLFPVIEGIQVPEEEGSHLEEIAISTLIDPALPPSLPLPSNALCVTPETTVHVTLKQAFARLGEEFLQPVVVVEDLTRKKVLGLVSLKALVNLQSQLLTEQLEKLSRKEDILRHTIQRQFKNTMEVRRSQARYHMLFENSGVGVALMNSEGQMTTCNHFLCRLLDLPDHELKKPIAFENYLLPLHRAEFIDTLKKLEAQGEKADTIHLEFPVKVHSDRKTIFHFTLNYIPETNQHCVCVADVTEERQLQNHVLQKEKDILLDSLVGGIAHELNNKILPLLGFTELLMEETQGAVDAGKVKHYGEIIRHSGSDCAAIVRQLLQLCKPVSRKVEDCDLRSVTKEALSFLTFRLRDSKVTVIERYSPEAVLVHSDPSQIKQIIINLCLNAIDALQDRSVRDLSVSVDVIEGQAAVQIQDTGSGIEPEVLPHIFDPFFTTKQAETARGLGLSISRSIARQYKGDIAVTTKHQTGSTFSLLLPWQQPSHAKAPTAPPTATSTSPGKPAQIRVLVVDDEEFVGSLVKEILRRKLNADVDRASNGQEAVDKMQHNVYDLVISDVRMPVMSGAELLKWTQENKPAQLNHFFFITGHEGSSHNSDEISRSNLPVLQKPFTVDALLNLCHKVLAK